jgi:hypothetical protein
VDVAHGVEQSLALLVDGVHDARVRVAGVGDAEGRGEVDEAVAVRVPDVGAGGALPEDRGSGLGARDVAALDLGQARGQGQGARSGNRRDERGREGSDGGHERRL